MNDRDRKYDRMDGERLYGRGELLDELMYQLTESCTTFGFDGVSGIGKSQVADRFADFASGDDARVYVRIDVAVQPSEELLIARLYNELRKVPKSFSQSSDGLASEILARAPGIAKRVLAGAFQDIMKKVSEHLEHTMEAVAKEISGEHSEGSTAALLADANSGNARWFIREFMTFVADLGNPVILLFENYETAEAGAQSFLNWLLSVKPDHWVVVLVANVEKLTETDWQNRMVPTIELMGGAVRRVDAPSRQAIAEWFEDVVRRAPSEADVDQAITKTNQGRPVSLREYLPAVAAGGPLPVAPAFTTQFTARRNAVGIPARRVAELMAFARAEARIPREWVESAAAHYGVDHVGSAIDELLSRSEIVVSDDGLSFYNSSYREGWRAGFAQPDLLKAENAWYEVYRARSEAMLSIPGAGILRGLALRIAANDDGSTITRVAADLIRSGSYNTALAIVDASWQADTKMASPRLDVIDHAIMAAQIRLDVGKYRDANESLQMVARYPERSQLQETQADLVRLKLALRQNAYPMVWTISTKLEKEAGHDAAVQLSRELVVNTAYRDLYRQSDISESVARIIDLAQQAPEGERAKAGRSVARSLAKLGRIDEALSAAESSLTFAKWSGDVREIANAELAMGESLRYGGRLEDAVAFYRDAEALARGSGNRDSEIWCILGRACAHLQAGDLSDAEDALKTATGVIHAPGFEHPLESAHLDMLGLILSSLRGNANDPADALRAYKSFGVEWPAAFLREVESSCRVADPIPI